VQHAGQSNAAGLARDVATITCCACTGASDRAATSHWLPEREKLLRRPILCCKTVIVFEISMCWDEVGPLVIAALHLHDNCRWHNAPSMDELKWLRRIRRLKMRCACLVQWCPRRAVAHQSFILLLQVLQFKSPAEFFAENQNIAGFDNVRVS
jgi:hypothetical protein